MNYENSTCRTPGSAASGQPGNGTLNQFNTGSVFRSNYSPSDFTLVELDDDPDPAFLVSFAGWDNRGLNASEAIAIHHPDTDEKRISFEYDPTTITSYLGNSVPGNGTHVRVIDWDLGTTEPGSSGSPLFDQDHRVIGQLHGGFASCTSQTSDWYGSMAVSWTGGGTSSTRLSNWLDPDGTGATVLDTVPAGGVRGSTKRYGTEIGGSNVGRLSSTSIPTIGASITLDATTFPNTSLLTLILSASQASTPFKGGTLLVDLSQVYTQRTLPVSGGSGSITLAIPDDTSLVGLTAYAQGGRPGRNPARGRRAQQRSFHLRRGRVGTRLRGPGSGPWARSARQLTRNVSLVVSPKVRCHVPQHQDALQLRTAGHGRGDARGGIAVRTQDQRSESTVQGERSGLRASG